MGKFIDKIFKGINPDDDQYDNDVFEDDEMYGDADGGMGGSGDLSDFISSSPGGYQSSPYGGSHIQNQNPNQNQGGYSQPQQPPPQPQYQQPQAAPPQPQPQNNSGGISVSGGVQYSVELKIVKSDNFNDGIKIADYLLNRKTVVLNLEETNKETARRLIDFLAGVAYAIQGKIERVSERTFVITPSNIGITSDQLKEEVRKSSGRADNTAMY